MEREVVALALLLMAFVRPAVSAGTTAAIGTTMWGIGWCGRCPPALDPLRSGFSLFSENDSVALFS